MNKTTQKNSYKEGYFHVYNRGNRGQDIFLDKEDYLNYLERLRKYKEKYNISVVCYCLMPNNFHLLLKENKDVPVSRFMHALHTSYSIYSNNKHNQRGHLFEGRFKHKEIEKEEYLPYITAYIHFNPIKEKSVEKLEDYQWSSYPDYIGVREGTLCQKDLILGNMKTEEYKKLTEEIKEKMLLNDAFFEAIL